MREYFGTEHWRRNRRLRPNSGGLQVPEHFDWMEVEKKERTQVKTADKEQESGDGSRLFEGFELQDGALVAAYLILATGTTDGADQLRDPVPDGRIGAMELQIGKNVSGQQIVRFHMPLVRDNLYVILRGVLVDQKLAGFTEEVHQITDGHVEPQGSATDLMETRKLDGFAMVALLMLARAIEEHGNLLSPDSGTDAQPSGEDPAQAFMDAAANEAEHHAPDPDLPQVELVPYLSTRLGKMTLSFEAGNAGEQKVPLTNLSDFVRAAGECRALSLADEIRIDFSRQKMTPVSERLLHFLTMVVEKGETKDAKTAAGIELAGWTMDLFYQAAEGQHVRLNRRRDLRIGRDAISCNLVIHEISDGALVTGTRPVRYKGVDHDYALTKNALTKLTTEEAKSLTMLDAVTGPGGKVHFAVSKDEMDTFEKRVLPALLSCPGIHVRKEKKRE